MQYLRISIVTPSYNQGRFIEQTILSVLNQGYPNFEHIIIDGGSTDDTIEILKRYPHLKWISEPDKGPANAINKGFNIATGQIFAYLCSDDLYAEGVFNFINSYFQEHLDVDMIYGECYFIDQYNRILRRKKAIPFNRQRLLKYNFIWQPTVFFRAEVFKRVGPFNEELNYAFDYEWWIRASFYCNIRAVPKHIAYYRWHISSKTVAQESRQLQEAYKVARKFGGGGIWSWYLHHIYWPKTGNLKRSLFSLVRRFINRYNK
jgi:glycosyltransferase involved in cell wall biosynthesis